MRHPRRGNSKKPHDKARQRVAKAKKWERAKDRDAPSTFFAKRSVAGLSVEEIDILRGL